MMRFRRIGSAAIPLMPAKAKIQSAAWCSGRALPRAEARGLFVALILIGAHLLAAVPARAQHDSVVNFYNWSDYVDPSVLDDFTKKTGIIVRYDTFDSSDTLE